MATSTAPGPLGRDAPGALSPARDSCQTWIDDHKEKKAKDEIAEGLTAVLDDLTDAQLARLSKQLGSLHSNHDRGRAAGRESNLASLAGPTRRPS